MWLTPSVELEKTITAALDSGLEEAIRADERAKTLAEVDAKLSVADVVYGPDKRVPHWAVWKGSEPTPTERDALAELLAALEGDGE